MMQAEALLISAVVMLSVGMLGFAMHRDFLRRIVAFNIMSTGTFLLLATLASPTDREGLVLPALLVFFLVVVSALTAIGLRLRVALVQRTGSADPDAGDES